MSLIRIDEWKDRNLFEMIRNDLSENGCQDGQEQFPYAAVVLAALVVGAKKHRLAEVTGYSCDFIGAIDNRMRAAEIWVEDRVANSDWESGCGFILHVSVAQGFVAVEPGSMPPRYTLTPRGHRRARSNARDPQAGRP